MINIGENVDVSGFYTTPEERRALDRYYGRSGGQIKEKWVEAKDKEETISMAQLQQEALTRWKELTGGTNNR